MAVSGSGAAVVPGARKKDAPADYRDFSGWLQCPRYFEILREERARAKAVAALTARFEARMKVRTGV